jgi:fatty-acyl-CoA synthase
VPASEDEADSASHRRLVRLGRPLPGLEIRTVEPDTGRVLAEREVGELEIRGTSVTPGYYRRDDLAAESFRDGWLRTGDLAYIVDGELVMCGRRKDVIIVGGRNVFPDDIERAVGSIDGVRAGNVVAFGVDGRNGKEAIIVVAEVRTDDETLVRKYVTERVREAVGVPPKDVVLVAPSTLPKTSSGKLQRGACRERYVTGLLGS